MGAEPKQDQALHDLELKISKMLRSGVYIAGMLLLIGWLWQLYNSGDTLSDFQNYESRSLVETIHWAVVMHDRPLIVSISGLVVLVLLPITRVFLTGILFVKQKDRVLAIMAFAVFTCLVASFFLGIDL
ncbi:DUF1634 domain-containing protein [Bdellovibrio sp. KM01]|uniref:DUF1634 domain-containing protein n=1 Tax=Bdellovibrio sp. KM01 TaxID=2748865 RepID=UPI0015EA0CC3|nr:DUF1634 domain-containing protein [Bdellovibrio sp. KM01]QLY23975.1 DUF1634 domain-containing protein [Bdellovibrio sp. KM01]